MSAGPIKIEKPEFAAFGAEYRYSMIADSSIEPPTANLREDGDVSVSGLRQDIERAHTNFEVLGIGPARDDQRSGMGQSGHFEDRSLSRVAGQNRNAAMLAGHSLGLGCVKADCHQLQSGVAEAVYDLVAGLAEAANDDVVALAPRPDDPHVAADVVDGDLENADEGEGGKKKRRQRKLSGVLRRQIFQIGPHQADRPYRRFLQVVSVGAAQML